MIKVYRIKLNDISEKLIWEVCYECAKIKKAEGHYISYDLTLSERSPLDRYSDCCSICEDSFFLDGRKIIEDLRSNTWAIC